MMMDHLYQQHQHQHQHCHYRCAMIDMLILGILCSCTRSLVRRFAVCLTCVVILLFLFFLLLSIFSLSCLISSTRIYIRLSPFSVYAVLAFGGSGVVAFKYGEDTNFTTSFYWAVVTASTIGYGDVVPTTEREI